MAGINNQPKYSSLKKLYLFLVYFFIFAIAVPGLHYLFGYAMDRLIINPFPKNSPAFRLIGLILVSTGGTVILIATSNLWRFGKGFPVSSLPPKNFVETGIYKFSRHPIYFGTLLCFFGISLFFHSFWNSLLSLPLLSLFFIAYSICVEEQLLIHRFGKRYAEYKNRLPIFFRFPLRNRLLNAMQNLFLIISNKVNHPFIVRFQNHIFYLSYGLLSGIGVVLGLTVLNLLLGMVNIIHSQTIILLVLITGTSLVGIRFVWITGVIISEKKDLANILSKVGFVSWGVLLAVVVTSIFFVEITGKSILVWFDCVLFSLMLTHFFGRIGCLFYGCCYGKATNSKLSISYSHAATKVVREGLVDPTHLYPVQLFSSFYGMFIFLLITLIWSIKELPAGLPATIICLLYSLFRFSEEWFRTQKKLLGNLLSPAQIMCIILILIGTTVMLSFLSNRAIPYYPTLMEISDGGVLSVLNIPLLLVLGFISTFVFSYHRKEIGRWT